MGRHFVPQEYLRHFGIPNRPSFVWQYDMRATEAEAYKQLPIRVVAQSREFYSEKDERFLSAAVERPAQKPLRHLRNGEQIDLDARRAVATYVESMIKRVPHSRRQAMALVPGELKKILAPMKRDTSEWARRFRITPEALLEEVARAERELDPAQLSMKDDIVRSQGTSAELVDAIFRMAWTMFTTHARLVTSDNPVFLHEGYGLKNPHAEFLFPLGPNAALYGRQDAPRRGLAFAPAPPTFVKEANRLTVSRADRFVFCQRREWWLPVVAKKTAVKT